MEVAIIILIGNISVSFILTGIIWVIQIVHYPSFHYTGEKNFSVYHQFHTQRISLLVVPLMLIELITSVVLTLFEKLPALLTYSSLACVLLIWTVTFLLQVPVHNKLSAGYNKQQVNKLVAGNWFRTILWSLKAILGIMLLIHH
ncbi:MAG: hypothetical protein ACFCU6_00655 [Balneolaceae bacterium]